MKIKVNRFFDKNVYVYTNNFFSYMDVLVCKKLSDKLLIAMFFDIDRSDTGLIKFNLTNFNMPKTKTPLYKYAYIYKKLDKYLKDTLNTDNIVFNVLDSNNCRLFPTINNFKKAGVNFIIDINFKQTIYDHDFYYVYLQNDTPKKSFIKRIKSLFSTIKEFMPFYL